MTGRVVSASGSGQVHRLSAALELHEDLVGGDTKVDLDAVATSGDVSRSLLDGCTEFTDIAGVDPVDAEKRGESYPGNFCELGIGWKPQGDRVVSRFVAHRLSVPPGVATVVTIADAEMLHRAGISRVEPVSMSS